MHSACTHQSACWTMRYLRGTQNQHYLSLCPGHVVHFIDVADLFGTLFAHDAGILGTPMARPGLGQVDVKLQRLASAHPPHMRDKRPCSAPPLTHVSPLRDAGVSLTMPIKCVSPHPRTPENTQTGKRGNGEEKGQDPPQLVRAHGLLQPGAQPRGPHTPALPKSDPLCT